ncbi:MAG: site-specific integrase [Nitrososphaera sp.]|nr:site-specific integrase [Nitrososphaera sp.]
MRNRHTRRAYARDVGDFSHFVGIKNPNEFRSVTRAHVIAWRDKLVGQAKMDASVRRSLSALSSLFDYLCNANAVTHNPVTGVERPSEGANEGKTPALSDKQVRALLDSPSPGWH